MQTKIEIGVAIAIMLAIVSVAGYVVEWKHAMEEAHSDIPTSIGRVQESVDEHAAAMKSAPISTARTPDDQEYIQGRAVLLGATAGTTACGVEYGPEAQFAAHYQLDCGTEVLVTNLTNKVSLQLRVLERAGSAEGWRYNVLAASSAAGRALGISGRADVRYVVENVP